MECFLHDRGPIVRMARPENPNEIDEYVNPFCIDWTRSDHFRVTVSGTLILSNRIGSRQRNGKKQSCSFTASIALSVLRRMAYPYLMMSAIFMGMPHS